ncbi:protein NATD1-like [Penaeus chinensis]|uniref:protein NATD1-like n=1 Tax=Penaeus chinensis TaxID=139456 RepID=UPI001FB74A44|nr:protein NATD1-like [Penaeus chinensis]
MAGSGRYMLRSLASPSGARMNPKSRMSSSEVKGLSVVHDEENMEFFIKLGKDKAFLQYDVIDPATGAVDLQHTVVPEVFRGQGIAKVLAKNVMDHFATKDKHMKLTCWYLQKFYKENPLPAYSGKIIE